MVYCLIKSLIIFISFLVITINTMPLDNHDNEITEISNNDCVRTSNMLDISKKYPNAVFPTLIDIGMCTGSCTISKRSIFEGKQMWKKETKKCAPTNYNLLSIYHYDMASNKIVPSKTLDIVVHECGCRV
uniref:TGF_BETA_2 domain-containing protein n=1 Tax=Strongyloides stercoralis TaxID=6248 RepID=A0A0K0EF34_STRER